MLAFCELWKVFRLGFDCFPWSIANGKFVIFVVVCNYICDGRGVAIRKSERKQTKQLLNESIIKGKKI